MVVNEAYLDQLGKKLDRALDMVSSGGGISGDVHFGRGTASFFEAGGQSKAKAVNGVPFYRGAPVSMPKGYKPAGFGRFGEFIATGMRSELDFNTKYGAAASLLAKSMGVQGTDFMDGGALILPEYSNEILSMLYQSDSLWGRTKQYTVKGNTMKFPRLMDQDRRDDQGRHGGARGYWVGEGDPITASKLKFGSTDISLVKLGVVVYITDEMLEDSGYALEQFVTEAVQAEIDYMLDRALLRGDGVSKPLGIFQTPAKVTVSKEGGQSGGTLVADNVLKMWARRMPPTPGSDLVWLTNQDIEPQLHKMALATGSSSGQLVYTPPGGFSDRPYATLMGRPVIPTEHASTLGTEGDISLVDFGHYLTANKGQINQMSSPHVEFLRQVNCLRFTFRINGRPFYDTPLRLEQSANLRSAFITLETRA